MDYSALAAELLSFRTALHHLPAVRGLDEMSGGEYFVLHFLLRHGGTAGPSELSRSLYASSARIAALLKHLEAKGWIVRTPDAADVRRVDVVLTEAGAACIRERHAGYKFGGTIADRTGFQICHCEERSDLGSPSGRAVTEGD